MAPDDTALVEHGRLTRRLPEETASGCSIDIRDEPFAEDVVARISPLGEARGRGAFERSRHPGENENPVGSFSAS